jgi:tripartite-type tricarboxylate transporter receptor subunit TctC
MGYRPVTHVPYRGAAPAVTDLLGGQTQVMFDNAASSTAHIRAGRLRDAGRGRP